MRKFLLFIIFLLIFFQNAESQRIGNIWYFGFNCGITFDTPDGHPKAIAGNKLKMWEGCATISNDAGTVDLYTNGIVVYNKQNAQMTSLLAGGSSSTQSVIIVPKPGDSLIYYLFTTDAWENQRAKISKGLNYSVADMRANGGLGDIVQLNVNLLDSSLEKVTFIKHRDTKSAWIIGHSYNTDEFFAFLLDTTGIHPPVISKVAPVIGDVGIDGDRGYMKASIDGKKIAAAYIQNTNVYLYDFDNSTGVVSNGQMLFPGNSALQFYGVEFSPDGSKLYASFVDLTRGIYQIDLSSGNIATIKNSAVLILDEKGFAPGALQLGPDGRIYVAKSETPYLHVIENPNLVYPQCSLKLNAVNLDFDNTGRICKLGLPNAINAIFYVKVKASASNPACEGDTVFLKALVDASANGYSVSWTGPNNFSSSSQDTMLINAKKNATGWYYVTVNLNGLTATDSVYILIADSPFTSIKISGKTKFCQGDSVILSAEPFNPSLFYKWSDGSTTKDIVVRTDGRVYLNVKNAGNCEYNDSIDIVVVPLPKISIKPNGSTVFCEGDSVVLEIVPFDINVNYLWSTGARTKFITVKNTGDYSVKAINSDLCEDSTKINIQVNTLPIAAITQGANISFCKGDSVIINAEPAGMKYLWSNGMTTQSITVSKPGKYNVIVENQNGCKDTASTLADYYPESILEIRGDKSFCKGDSTELYAYGNFKEYQWSTGETTKSISVKSKGMIKLKAMDYYGCFAYDSVNIDVFELKVDDSAIKNIQFGRVFIDGDSIRTVRIYNNDAGSFDITNVVFSNPSVFTNLSTLPATVVPGQYFELKIKFSPKDIINYQESLQVIISTPCKITLSGKTEGTGIVEMIVALPDTSGKTGEKDFCIPVTSWLNTQRSISASFDWFLSIIHKADGFSPNAGISNTITGKNRISSFQGISTLTDIKSDMTSYCGLILLGESLYIPLLFDSIFVNNPNIIISNRPGSITTNGICVRNLSKIIILQKPDLKIGANPFSDNLKFDLHNPNVANIKVKLIGMNGITSENLFENQQLESGDYSFNFDLSSSPDGLYFLVIYFNDNIFVEKLIKIKTL